MMQPHVVKRVVASDILTRAETSHAEKAMATKLPNRMDFLLIFLGNTSEEPSQFFNTPWQLDEYHMMAGNS